MAGPPDAPLDPETGRVVDRDVLAERRARRGELELDPLERLQRAEQLAATLRRRLESAEESLAGAQRECASATAQRARAEQEVAEAVRREQAERRLRAEQDAGAGVARERLEARAAALAHERDAAVGRAGELARALEQARGEAVMAAEAARRAGASREEHDRGQAALVQLELARSAAAHEAVTRGMGELRQALEVVRVRADARAEEDGRVRGELAALTGQLEEERLRRTALEALVGAERSRAVAAEAQLQAAGAAPAPAPSGAPAAAEAARARGEAELAARRELEEQVRAALASLRTELEEARRENAARAAREAEVGRVVGGLAASAERLRAGAAAAGASGAASELRRRLEEVSQELGGRVAEEQAARRAAEAALAAHVAHAALPASGAGGEASDLESERSALRPVPGALPAADHPALARAGRASAGAVPTPPPVVADLSRAMERLRAPAPEDPTAPAAGTGAPAPAPPAREGAASTVLPSAAVARADAPARLPRVAPVAGPPEPWIAPALTTLAALDQAAAARLLLAFLAVQRDRVRRPVRYALALPGGEVHQVAVVPRELVSTTREAGPRPAFTLTGSVAALAPLVGGAARRRLPGVAVRGRRRRARRLLRALRAPVGLAELRAARPRALPGDLLALLCAAVPAARVEGEDFTVAWVVQGDGQPSRTLVRAAPEGSLAVRSEPLAATGADATVTLAHDALLAALDGSAEVAAVEGDATAVARLREWLLDAQRRPVRLP